MKITNLLKPSAAARDTKVFKAWEDGMLTDREALNEFKKNNDIDEQIEISEFIDYIATLGYWR